MQFSKSTEVPSVRKPHDVFAVPSATIFGQKNLALRRKTQQKKSGKNRKNAPVTKSAASIEECVLLNQNTNLYCHLPL